MKTETLRPDAAGLARAAGLLRDGALVAFGTETVYGLGGDAGDPHAVAAIFAAKRRPAFNPLICHLPDAAAAWALVDPGRWGPVLAERFWPGPLTLVLPRRADCPVADLAGAGLDSLAVRVPRGAAVTALLRAVARPVAAPSANLSGGVSPSCAAHVLDGLSGRIAAVLDTGPCAVGLESTVLDLTGPAPALLRPGGVEAVALAAILGPLASRPAGGALRGPGMLESHYAPALPVRLAAHTVAETEALLAFGPPLQGAGLVYQLSEAADPTEAATRLFAGLRWLDATGRQHGLRGIAAMPVPETGLGIAINDRLGRAAAPRAF